MSEGDGYQAPERQSQVPGLDEAAQKFYELSQSPILKDPVAPEVTEEEPEAAEVELEAAEEAEAEPEEEEESEAESHDPVLEIDGRQYTADEIHRGFLRQADYTRKTAELATQRRELENRAQEVSRTESEALSHLHGLIQKIQQDAQLPMPSPQEMEILRRADPAEYSARVLDYQARNARMQEAQRELQRHEQAEAAKEIPREREALMDTVPDFRREDGSFNADLYRQVGEFAVKGGYMAPEMWGGLTNHQLITLVFKAMRHDEVTRKAPKVSKTLAKRPRILRPGTVREPGHTQAQGAQAAMAHLRENPNSLEAAAAAYRARFGGSER